MTYPTSVYIHSFLPLPEISPSEEIAHVLLTLVVDTACGAMKFFFHTSQAKVLRNFREKYDAKIELVASLFSRKG